MLLTCDFISVNTEFKCFNTSRSLNDVFYSEYIMGRHGLLANTAAQFIQQPSRQKKSFQRLRRLYDVTNVVQTSSRR